MTIEQRVRKALDEIRPILQADGGDLELVAVDGATARVRLRGACAGCPSANATLRNVVEEKIREHCPEIEQVVDVGKEPEPHGRIGRSPFEDQAPVHGVKAILAVASGKGGVGKSTVAVNLALALARQDLRIGLLDADVYGPSIPTMLGVTEVPTSDAEGVAPVERHGITLMSIGFFLEPSTPVIWRGRMVMKALSQFLREVRWGQLDCLVVDLPPGTGDAQLTVVQVVPVTGALIVTTPSDVALLDARRAIGMFERVGVPVIGVVENMSHFVCPHCSKATDVFSHGGAATIAREAKVPLLGEIPLHAAICHGGDHGRPVMVEAPEGAEARAFVELAGKVRIFLDAAERLRAPLH